MFPNVKASEQVAVLGSINPSSQAAGGASTGWIPAMSFSKFLALVQAGAFGAAATVDASIQQAQDANGTNAKAIAGKAIATLVAANNANDQVEINLDAQELDVANGFSYINLTITVGAAATLTAGLLLGFVPRYAPASDYNAASVAQIVG